MASSAPAAGIPIAPLVFDCEGLGPTLPATCEGLPPAGRELVDAARWFGNSAVRCAAFSGERVERAGKALRRASNLELGALSPLSRAVLQNAALRLVSCGRNAEPQKGSERIVHTARRLVDRLALSDAEIAALPTSTGQLDPWLAPISSWLPGTGAPPSIHETGSGYTLAQQPLKRDNAFANVGRLIVVDKDGAPRVTDTVLRLHLRRTEPSRVRVCLAELDPGEGCGAALRPIDTAVGTSVLAGGNGGLPCGSCHVGGRSLVSRFVTAAPAGIASREAANVALRELGPLLREKGP